MKAYFSNTGCTFEEEDFIRFLRLTNAEQTKNILEADVIIAHFCALSTESFKSIPPHMAILQGIKQELKPQVKIFIGGCASKVLDLKKRYPFVDGVFNRGSMIKDLAKYFGYDLNTISNLPICNGQAVSIQSGCLRNCGFCKKAYLDMPLRSKPIEKVLLDIKEAISQGHPDILLFAENSTEYGIDLDGNARLIDLLKAATNVEGLKSITLTGVCIDELAFNTVLLDFIKNCKKIYKVQIEIQSLIPEVRKNMRLTSSTEDVLRVLKELSSKYIITNIMIGYPGETDENFKEQLSLIEKYGLYYVQVNTYDNTPFVYGSTFKQIPKNLVDSRTMMLINTINKLRSKKAAELKMLSRKDPISCIYTSSGTFELLGHSANIDLKNASNCKVGDIIKVYVKDPKHLIDMRSPYQSFVLEGVKV